MPATNEGTSPDVADLPGSLMTSLPTLQTLANHHHIARIITRVVMWMIPQLTKPSNPSISYGGTSFNLLSIPITGADITAIGTTHLDALNIPRTSLSPTPNASVFTADGSSMNLATLQLSNRSCFATIQVHEGIQTPLSCGHCQFPKHIAITHVNRCIQIPASTMTSSAAAAQDLRPTDADPLEACGHTLCRAYTYVHPLRLQGTSEGRTRFPGAAGNNHACG